MSELSDILALASNYENKAVPLSGESRAVLYYALEAIKDSNYWKQNSAEVISDSDKDEIDRIVSGAFYDLSQEAVCPTMAYISEIRMFAGETLPDGWVWCDGQLLDRTTYADLFAEIFVWYGSTNGGNFRVPDMRRRSPVGADDDFSGTSDESLAASFGEESHVLTVAEIPAHSHNSHVQTGTGLAGTQYIKGNATQNTPVETGSTGGDTAHENRSPGLAVNFAIYTGVLSA